MTRISPEVKNSITVALYSEESAQSIAARFGVHVSTVYRVKYAHNLNIPSRSAGRPAKLSPTAKRRLLRMFTTGEVSTATQAARLLSLGTSATICAETVRRTLKKANFHSMIKKKKPLFLPRHRSARVRFARKYQHWTVDQWRKVIWSDETRVHRIESAGSHWGWRRRGTPLQASQVRPIEKFGGGSILIWGCMTAKGLGYCCKLDEGLDAELYADILDDELRSTINDYGYYVDEVIFQHDNAPPHTSSLARG